MSFRRFWGDCGGSTLMELLVGAAVAVVVLFAVVDAEVATMRFQASDDDRFAKQTDVGLLVDGFLADARQATAFTLTDGTSTIAMTLSSGSITYRFDAATGEVVRQTLSGSRVVGRGITSLAFFGENSGKTVRIEVAATLRSGTIYRIVSRAARRL